MPEIGFKISGSSAGSQVQSVEIIRRAPDGHVDYRVYRAGHGVQSAKPVLVEYAAEVIAKVCSMETLDVAALRWSDQQPVISRPAMPDPENIYFIQDVLGNIKIGFARNVQSRIETLQTANSSPLRLIGSINGNKSKEAELHRRFAGARIRGEWFTPTDDLMNYIQEVAA
ncbi:MAG: GIY-YIG nuclease family protein [Rhodoferax sp.]|nr:GIY-YIG nuclease family protein [Rhodoferax sp.]